MMCFTAGIIIWIVLSVIGTAFIMRGEDEKLKELGIEYIDPHSAGELGGLHGMSSIAIVIFIMGFVTLGIVAILTFLGVFTT